MCLIVNKDGVGGITQKSKFIILRIFIRYHALKKLWKLFLLF